MAEPAGSGSIEAGSAAASPTGAVVPSTFEYALAFVLRMEGGDSDHPADSGGHTRYGISKNSHPDVDVPNLTLAQAREIYRADYWAPLQCDLLPRALAVVVFDCGVNQGVKVAASLLQQAAGVQMDGNVGPRTLAAAGRIGASTLLPRYQRLRARRYVELARSKPSQQVFLDGWLQRLFEGAQAALVMP